MSIISKVYNELIKGDKSYNDLFIIFPEISKQSIYSAIYRLTTFNAIAKNADESAYCVIKPIRTDFRVISQSKPAIKPEVIEKAPKPISNDCVVEVPDFNKMMFNLVEAMSQEIAKRVRTRTLEIVFSQESIENISQQFANSDISVSIPTLSVTDPLPVKEMKRVVLPAKLPPTVIDAASMISKLVPPTEPEKATCKIRLPRVCITGLKPYECGKLSTEWGQTFDLRFWNNKTGDGVDQLQAHSKNCDVIFWHVKHSAHSDEEIATKGTAKLVRVLGDLSQMRRQLKLYFNELQDLDVVA